MQIKIENKVCPICGKSLVTHQIPKEALERFINSSVSIRNGDNVVKRYASSLQKTSQVPSLRGVMRFCWIVHKTPKELIDMGYNELGLRDS